MVAKETHADLIVVGSQIPQPRAPLIGATAERIAELAGRPVLITNLDPRERYGTVLMAAELSAAFIQVARVASQFGLLKAESVSVVHGFESPYRGALYCQGFDERAAQRNIEEWRERQVRGCCGNLMTLAWRVPGFILFFSRHVRFEPSAGSFEAFNPIC